MVEREVQQVPADSCNARTQAVNPVYEVCYTFLFPIVRYIRPTGIVDFQSQEGLAAGHLFVVPPLYFNHTKEKVPLDPLFD